MYLLTSEFRMCVFTYVLGVCAFMRMCVHVGMHVCVCEWWVVGCVCVSGG